jgi:hypothetical protein
MLENTHFLDVISKVQKEALVSACHFSVEISNWIEIAFSCIANPFFENFEIPLMLLRDSQWVR